jgi:hypothetical protein
MPQPRSASPTPKRWRPIEAELGEFRRYLYDGFPPLKICEGYDSAWERGPLYKSAVKARRYYRAGVYLFFDVDGKLLYVGKGMWFYGRIFRHAIPGARYVDLIAFDEQHAPFLSALEHFLICRLKPHFNKNGREYEVPCLVR